MEEEILQKCEDAVKHLRKGMAYIRQTAFYMSETAVYHIEMMDKSPKKKRKKKYKELLEALNESLEITEAILIGDVFRKKQ